MVQEKDFIVKLTGCPLFSILLTAPKTAIISVTNLLFCPHSACRFSALREEAGRLLFGIEPVPDADAHSEQHGGHNSGE